ncbi:MULTISPECIES: DUF3482 domain-containing protein [unclassified Moraxella]|uniref:GTPase/DUF3482 domain-containing protein n=1 Tax=unclassified Moraxella TaxID=2685852 RepID=UPI003AF68C37
MENNQLTKTDTDLQINLDKDFFPAVKPTASFPQPSSEPLPKQGEHELTPFDPSNQNHQLNQNQLTQNSPKKVSIGENEALKLAVVGHTNTGKTSLLRTLLRDVYFGEVKNAPATTRHVEKALISDSQTGQNLVALYDTPGLEDATGLLDWLEENTASRRDGVERLQQFLASPLAQDDYSQEAKVIRQLLASDMAIYVIDAREPVLGKYKDELTVLSWSAIPVMPVFNFTHEQNSNIIEWQQQLARRNLHVSTRFDSVAFEFDDEIKLWQNLATMLIQPEIVSQLIERRQADWDGLYDDANIIIAHFLLNVASFVESIHEDDDPLPTLNKMQEKVRQAERAVQDELLNLYKFYDNTVATTPLELTEYRRDPFDSELLASYGIRTTSGAAAGALIGLGIDAATLGTSLGLGTALGGLIGGIAGNTGAIADKISGVKRLYIDPATITLLATRAMDLLNALRHRGHASTETIMTKQALAPWSPDKLPSLLKKARGKPEWSSLNGGKLANSAHDLRDESAWQLSRQLRR